MRPDDHIRVLHMIEAIQTAMEFVSGRQAADLETDRMLKSGDAQINCQNPQKGYPRTRPLVAFLIGW
ncbi:MAG: hypothetical protein WAN11_07310 [Syntrophobacteraceae bacterium]